MKKSLGAKSLAFPTPTWVVGSYDSDGRANVATIAWGGICCSAPPCVAISLRQATYSHGCIVRRQAFTVNVPSELQIVAADFFGISSGRTVDKLATAGFTAVKSELVDAPYIGEFPMVLECKLVQTLELGLHTQFVGEIMDVKVDEEALTAEGRPDPAQIRPVVYLHEVRKYYGLGPMLGEAFSIGKDYPR